ncbi:MAG: hypothetical protein ACRC7O_14070, partial [Fimbriiglobus sp.]
MTRFTRLLAALGTYLVVAGPASAQSVAVVGSGGQFGFFDLTTRGYSQVAGSISGASDVRNIA